MKKTFVAKLFEKLARKARVDIDIEEKYGFVGRIKLKDGSVRYFSGTKLDINSRGAAEIATDKDYSYYFLKRLGYPTVPGQAFFSNQWAKALGSKRNIKAALKYAKKLGFPVIVKPNSLSQGQLVCKVSNEKQFLSAAAAIALQDRVFLVQRVVNGKDYRVVVLDGRVVSAYERLPLTVVADGKSTIDKLIDKKQKLFYRTDRSTKIDKKDFRITNKLHALKLNRNSVPEKGERIELLDNRNLSSGGEAVEVTGRIHKGYEKICIQLVKDMGLRYCGVDLMIEGDITESPGKYKIIEINSAPGIGNYAHSGKKQLKIVEDVYLKVLKAMARSNKVYLLGEPSTEKNPVRKFLSFRIVKYR